MGTTMEKNAGSEKPAAVVSAAAPVNVTDVSLKTLPIGGGPIPIYLTGTGFDCFNPKPDDPPPVGRLEAYILDAEGTKIEKAENIRIVQPQSDLITATKFPIVVTVIKETGYEEGVKDYKGERKIVIKNKYEPLIGGKCDAKSVTCHAPTTFVITIK